jgi:hypothetical protein
MWSAWERRPPNTTSVQVPGSKVLLPGLNEQSTVGLYYWFFWSLAKKNVIEVLANLLTFLEHPFVLFQAYQKLGGPDAMRRFPLTSINTDHLPTSEEVLPRTSTVVAGASPNSVDLLLGRYNCDTRPIKPQQTNSLLSASIQLVLSS